PGGDVDAGDTNPLVREGDGDAPGADAYFVDCRFGRRRAKNGGKVAGNFRFGVRRKAARGVVDVGDAVEIVGGPGHALGGCCQREFDLHVVSQRGSCVEYFDADQASIAVEIDMDPRRYRLSACGFAACHREPNIEEITGGIIFDLHLDPPRGKPRPYLAMTVSSTRSSPS